MSTWVLLKSPCHMIVVFAWGEGGAYYVSVKKTCEMKYGFEGSIFKSQSWPVLAKQPHNV